MDNRLWRPDDNRVLDQPSHPLSLFCMTGTRQLLETPEPPALGPVRRAGTLPLAEIDRALGANANPLARATVLLWHDHLDEAHQIAQEIENADGSYIHGIMHRREPDYSNARYWFRRVGPHPCFKPLRAEAERILTQEKPLLARFTGRGEWDAIAFVDACEQAANAKLTGAQAELLRQIQAAELRLLLARFQSTD